MAVLERDGVKLAYEERGEGSPAMVLVHGWTCDRSHMAAQAEHFSREHTVVAVDLRGHGESDKPEVDYTMELLASDVAWMIAELGLERPVVVGHSMGGLVALALAANHPDAARAVVLLDSPLYPPGAIRAVAGEFLDALKGEAYAAAQRQFVDERLFVEWDDPELKARVMEGMGCTPQHVMASCMNNLADFDSGAAAAQVSVPILALFAERPLLPIDWLLEKKPEIVTGQTVGAGHFHQMLVPEQVNLMIEGFLRLRVRERLRA
jgi:pimeloyl-ACP methyl ester carboxylesterase